MQHSSAADFAAASDLAGERVTLTQLQPAHAEALSRAAADLASAWVTSVPGPEAMPAEIARRLDLQRDGTMAPFTVLDRGVPAGTGTGQDVPAGTGAGPGVPAGTADTAQGTPVGMTTYMNIDAANRRLEIGSTWLSPSVQGTRVNPEAKLLMLTHAFEELDCIAVEFRTHFHNFQSRAAIAKLGARQDGILRSHQIFHGVLRDTVVFSITAAEWPTVKLGLHHRLARLD